MDSTVKVRGVCCTQFNLRRQFFDIRLLLPRRADLVVRNPPRRIPLPIPAQPISSLLQFTAEGHLMAIASRLPGR